MKPLQHRHPLVSLWKCEKPRDRFDIYARLREIEGHIVSGALDQPEVAASPYDFWLNDRFQKGRDETWFKGQPLFAATTFCRLLGQALFGTSQSEGTRVRNTVHSIGFDVARYGEATIREALGRLAAAATGHLDEPNKAFGAMYTGLNRDYLAEDGFAPYRRILRACILDNWPIAPGETLLGEVVPERRMHSVVTAAKATGVGVQVIEHFLSEIGSLVGQDHRPSSRRVFDARAHAHLLAEIPNFVGPIAMRSAMEATRGELVALEEEGILIPSTRVAQVKKPWRISDGAALVAELLTSAVPIQKHDDGWETLLLARQRRKLGISLLIRAIRAGRLSVGNGRVFSGFTGSSSPRAALTLSPPGTVRASVRRLRFLYRSMYQD